MNSLTFKVEPCPDTGGYVARWDDPAGGGITTQGDSFAELDAMIRDAVTAYFLDRTGPCETAASSPTQNAPPPVWRKRGVL